MILPYTLGLMGVSNIQVMQERIPHTTAVSDTPKGPQNDIGT